MMISPLSNQIAPGATGLIDTATDQAAGFAIWLFGYLSAGHASAFDWVAATPSWISSFVPNLEAELGLALMFASMIPIYWQAGWDRCFQHRSRYLPSNR
jgi:hypothetical protein